MVDYPRVYSCFGGPLHKGCIIIGIMCVVLGVLLEVWYFTNLFSEDPSEEEELEEEDVFLEGEEEEERLRQLGCTRQGRRHFAYGVTFIFLGILIIVAVKEDAHWMILIFTWMILSLGVFIFSVGFSYMIRDFFCNGVVDLFWGVISLVFGIVFSIVALSYFREVKEMTEYHLEILVPPGVLPQEAEQYQKAVRASRSGISER